MATKVTTVSLDPNFKTFEDWSAQKISEFNANGNSATADAWVAALSAKAAAEASTPGYTRSVVDQNTVILSTTATTPEFEAIFEQWKTEYDVEFVAEEV